MKFKTQREAMIYYGFDPDTELIYIVPYINGTRAIQYGLSKNIKELRWHSHRPPHPFTYIIFSFNEIMSYNAVTQSVSLKQSFIDLYNKREGKYKCKVD